MKRFVVALASVLVVLMGGSVTMAFGLGDQPGGPATESVSVDQAVAGPAVPSLPQSPSRFPRLDRVTELPGQVGPALDGVLAPLGLAPRPHPARSGPAADDRPVTFGDLVAEQLKKAPGSPFAGLAAGAYAGYATGTAYTTDADLSGLGTEIEVGFSGATYGSAPLPARVDERERSVSPALAAAQGFGRGSATEIGTGEDRVGLDDDSEAKAPPPTDGDSKELTDVDVMRVINADLLQSRASARSASNGCVVGSDLASGQGSATRTDLVNEENKDAPDQPILSLSEDEPERAVTQSVSRTALLPAGNSQTARFGLVSETRQTIAPITLFKGRPQEMTIEIGGEWILRAVADGSKGFISYGPEVEPGTPILRIDQKDGRDLALTLEDLREEKGGTDLGAPGVEEFIIGEDPRAIGGQADTQPIATGTLAAAAVDILRVRIPDDEQPDGVLDVRVGHMEVAAAVPPGGISCPGIGMGKESSRASVAPGQRFSWTITVGNSNDCLLDKVKVVDRITASPGLRYRVVFASPKGAVDDRMVTFDGVGPLRMGQSRTLRIDVEVDETSPPGTFTDEAVATGQCGPARVTGDAATTTGVGSVAPVPREGRVSLEGPEVTPSVRVAAGLPPTLVAGGTTVLRPAPVEDVDRSALAATGWRGRLLPGVAFLTTGVLLRRIRRRA